MSPEYHYSPTGDVLDITLLPDVRSVRTEELTPDVRLDWDRKGRLIGIEILNASAYYPGATLEHLGDGTQWLTLAEAEAEGRPDDGPTATRLRALLNTGRLPGRKIGRDWQIARHELWNYLENRPPVGRPPVNKAPVRRRAARAK